MNPILVRGVIMATLALASYSTSVLIEQRKSSISRRLLAFFTVGVGCDISSVFLMIIGSRGMLTTFHGVFGYTALAAMLIDTVLMWRRWRGREAASVSSVRVPRGLHLYTRAAYSWWVSAYIAGVIIGMTLG